MTNPQWSGGDCINPAQAYTHNLVNPLLFSVVKTVKEASAVCRSFLDGVVIFFEDLWQNYMKFPKKFKYLRKLSIVCHLNFSLVEVKVGL